MLTNREKTIAIISNGISVFSLLREQGRLPEDATMYDFVLRIVPDELRWHLDADLIDEVFACVTSAHGSYTKTQDTDS